MRKKFKKITAIVLTAAMAFSVAIPAFATESSMPDTVYIVEGEHGEWNISNARNSATVATKADNGVCYKANVNGEELTFLEIDNDTLFRVDEVAINEENVEAVIASYNIVDAMAEDLRTGVEDPEANITAYLPRTIGDEDYTTAAGYNIRLAITTDNRTLEAAELKTIYTGSNAANVATSFVLNCFENAAGSIPVLGSIIFYVQNATIASGFEWFGYNSDYIQAGPAENKTRRYISFADENYMLARAVDDNAELQFQMKFVSGNTVAWPVTSTEDIGSGLTLDELVLNGAEYIGTTYGDTMFADIYYSFKFLDTTKVFASIIQ